MGLSAPLLVLSSALLWTQTRTQTQTQTFPSGLLQDLRAAVGGLAEEGRTYLGRVAGEQTVLSVQKAFSQVIKVFAENVAVGLNIILENICRIFESAGIKVPVISVTPAGLLFVLQWLAVALLTYWILRLALQLLGSALRRLLWLVKVSAAVMVFALILRDYGVGSEVMVVRLAVLMLVCVLLGVGTSGSEAERRGALEERSAALEEQLRILKQRLRDLESPRRD